MQHKSDLRDAVVYVIDGDTKEWAYLPGQWLEADLSVIEVIEDSSWRLHITHEDEYGWVGTDYEPIYDTAHDLREENISRIK